MGGLEDVETEYGMFAKFHPDTLRVPVGGTCGAAACLPKGNCEAFGLDDFEQIRTYIFLAHCFVETLAQISVPAISPIRRVHTA